MVWTTNGVNQQPSKQTPLKDQLMLHYTFMFTKNCSSEYYAIVGPNLQKNLPSAHRALPLYQFYALPPPDTLKHAKLESKKQV